LDPKGGQVARRPGAGPRDRPAGSSGQLNAPRGPPEFTPGLQREFHPVGGRAQTQMVVRGRAGDVDRRADDVGRIEQRADRNRGGEAVEEVPPAQVFNGQRRFAFGQNRVCHMVMLSRVVVASRASPLGAGGGGGEGVEGGGGGGEDRVGGGG